MPQQAIASFGEQLRQYRRAAGLTQEALAERAGLSVHRIQKLERGVTNPYRDAAQRLAAALQLGPYDEISFGLLSSLCGAARRSARIPRGSRLGVTCRSRSAASSAATRSRPKCSGSCIKRLSGL